MDREVESVAPDKRRNGDGDPMVGITLAVPASILSSVLEQSGCKGFLTKKSVNEYGSSGINLWRFSDGSYELDDELTELIDKKQRHAVDEATGMLRYVWSQSEGPAGPDESSAEGEGAAALLTHVQSALPGLPADAAKQVKPYVERLQRLHTRSCIDDLTRRIAALAPRMMLFSDFDDLLPHQIEIAEAAGNATVADFAKLADLDLKRLQETSDLQVRRNRLSRCSGAITGDFMDYWNQDSVCLTVEPDGSLLRFGVKDGPDADLLKVEQRSKGFQWFLSFFIRLNAQPSPDSVLLIDEPGLYLHAKAQRDVLHLLEQLSATHQIVFATHSPYLIDTDHLSRIRLVHKGPDGTSVENKFHKLGDQETLTPVITAIGLDVSTALAPGVSRNVVVEGISDYYYLLAFRTLLAGEVQGGYSILPAVGAPKIPQIVSLLMGWGLAFAVLLDGDAEGKRIRKELLDGLHVSDDRVVTTNTAQGRDIEDVFTPDDFGRYVLELSHPPAQTTNSQWLKSSNYGKALAAKRFYDKVKEGQVQELSSETLSRFTALLQSLDSAIGPE